MEGFVALSDKDEGPRKDEKKKENEMALDVPINQMPAEDDYDIVKLISMGAYGSVYLVRHKETRQKFAMKRIDKQSLILRNQVEQAFAERDIMSFTDNPFVVSLYCSFETKRHLCLVMEYVEGGDLSTLLKNMGPLPVDLARFYFAETVLAVEYLHSYSIVHRDLKPENLLITALGHIKLTDFGLSKIGLMNRATNICEEHKFKKDTKEFNDKQVCGTPEYIAPEVILRQGYGKPVDWWSMGIILYELLIGCVPFFGETPEELFAHVINDEITWPDEDDWPLSEDSKDVISQLLKRDPVERLGTGGSREVKEHPFFENLNWDDLLRQKAEFVPQLENDEDTSYFDTRTDRYNHEIDDSEEQDDTDESSSSMFSSFSSCSPKYHRVYSRIEQELAKEKLLKSASTSSILDESVQTFSTINDSFSGSLEISVGMKSPPVDPASPSLIATPSTDLPLTPTSQKKSQPTPEPGKPITHSTPDSSQTESENLSPKIARRKKPLLSIKHSIPHFSISGDTESIINEPKDCVQPTRESDKRKEKDDKNNKDSIVNSQKSHIPRSSHPVQFNVFKSHHSHHHHQSKCRAVTKSASATGLSLVIPSEDCKVQNHNLTSSGGSSTSSRDGSPNRDIANSPGQQLKPPIIIRRGPKGFGFTLRAIRVYYGDSDLYTVHHLILAVENNSPAFEAGLRPNSLITHINGEAIQGLLHHQVLQLVLSGGDKINIRTTPLENTTIKTGGRRRNPSNVRMIRRSNMTTHRKYAPVRRSDSDKRRRSSLLRKLNSKRASAEIQQLMTASGAPSPPLLAPSRSFQSLSVHRSPVDPEVSSLSPNSCLSPSSHIPRHSKSPPNRLHCSPESSVATSSQSSSPGSSVPNSPAGLSLSFSNFSRPSTLAGLKQTHKTLKSLRSPRRKSCGHIPLSPLARTPSPSLQPTNAPTPIGHHQPGSSQTTQTFFKNKVGDSSVQTTPTKEISITDKLLTPPGTPSRPKSAEPNSPTYLLRTTLSPDRFTKKHSATKQSSKSSVSVQYKRHSLGGVSSPLALSSLPPSNSPSKTRLSERKQTTTPQNNDTVRSHTLSSDECKADFSPSPLSVQEEACSSDDSTEKISQILEENNPTREENGTLTVLDVRSRCKRDLSSDDSISSKTNDSCSPSQQALDKKSSTTSEQKNRKDQKYQRSNI